MSSVVPPPNKRCWYWTAVTFSPTAARLRRCGCPSATNRPKESQWALDGWEEFFGQCVI